MAQPGRAGLLELDEDAAHRGRALAEWTAIRGTRQPASESRAISTRSRSAGFNLGEAVSLSEQQRLFRDRWVALMRLIAA